MEKVSGNKTQSDSEFALGRPILEQERWGSCRRMSFNNLTLAQRRISDRGQLRRNDISLRCSVQNDLQPCCAYLTLQSLFREAFCHTLDGTASTAFRVLHPRLHNRIFVAPTCSELQPKGAIRAKMTHHVPSCRLYYSYRGMLVSTFVQQETPSRASMNGHERGCKGRRGLWQS
jgi:hypothetical protein